MAVELKDAEKLKIKPDPIQDLTIGQTPEVDPVAAEKLKIQSGAQETVRGNFARGEDLRMGLEKRLQTSDGQWYRFNKVGQTHAEGKPPELKPIKLDERGKEIDPKLAKQFLIPEISDWMKNDIEWPEYVPEKFRNEESFNKWNRGRYGLGYRQTQKVKVQNGLIVPQETGHLTASSDTNIGMNPWVGAQVKYGPEGNQTTTQKYIVEQGDTLVSVGEKFGVNPKQIKDANKDAKVKRGIIISGQTIKIQTLKKNTDDTRLASELEHLDMGGKDTRTSQFKAVEEWIGHFAPESEKGKYNVHTVDTLGARDMGKIGHDTEFDPTASGALAKVKQKQLEGDQRAVLRENNPYKAPSNEEKFKADLIAKNPTLPNTLGLQPNTSSARSFHDRIKSHLQSQGFQREAARIAGQSNIPWVNIAGDFVGVIYDGLEVAANPRDARAITELIMSGTQLGTGIVGAGLMAFPEPTTSGLGWVIMKAGDNVGRVERLWNMGRESMYAERYKGLEKTDKGNIFINKKPKPQVQQLVKGTEVAEVGNEIQLDKRMKRVRIKP